MVLFNFSVALPDFSMVLLNVSRVLLGFSVVFTTFSHSFTPFFHGLSNFQMFLLDFSIILPFHSSLPKCTSEDGPGGNRCPPSPNCHLVHNLQKSSNSHASTAPISVMLRWPRPLYPQTPYNDFVRKRNFA